jgi:septal ring factor EnvC (AmiA/AmiB activator)
MVADNPPCADQIKRIKQECYSMVGMLEKELDENKSKLAEVAQDRDQLLRSNRSLAETRSKQAQEIAAQELEIYRLKREKESIIQEYSRYRAETQPLVKKDEARKKAEEQKRRGQEIMEKGANLWNGLAEDPYKIRRAKP